MARGYETGVLRERTVDLLRGSKTGMSGVEISERLGIGRATMTKYLGVFAAEGMIGQKNIGNVTLWFVDGDAERFTFPDDYHLVQKRYAELLTSFSGGQAQALVRNCLHSGAAVPVLMAEVVVPAIGAIHDLFEQGRAGTAEASLLRNIVAESIGTAGGPSRGDPSRNVIVLAADPESVLVAEAASASYRSAGWSVFPLGDMSSAADILFDLDLQKLLLKIWRKRTGIMLVAVFSGSEEGLNFFAESIEAVRGKYGRRLFSVMSGPVGEKTSIKADLVSCDLAAVLRWSEDVFEGGAGTGARRA